MTTPGGVQRLAGQRLRALVKILKMKNAISLLSLPLIAAGLLYSQALKPVNTSPGLIQGQVIGPNGKGLAGLPIHLIRQFSPSAQFSPSIVITKTNADGFFGFNLLAAGRYIICARPQSDYIDHCNWQPQPPFDLAKGQSLTLPNLQLQSGYWLQVQIKDPGGLLEKNERTTANANLTVGVTTQSGVFVPSRSHLAANGQKTMEMFVPNSASFITRVHSTFYKLTDDNGTEVDKDHGSLVPSISNVKLLTYHVTGLH